MPRSKISAEAAQKSMNWSEAEISEAKMRLDIPLELASNH
jgi:hypothetical protein